MLQNATHLRKSSSWPPNICDRDVSCSVPATRTASLQILLEHPPPASVLEIATKNPHLCSLLARCRITCACHDKWHLNVQKWSEHVVPLAFTFAPQRRAIFEYLNFQNCLENVVLLAYFSTFRIHKNWETFCLATVLFFAHLDFLYIDSFSSDTVSSVSFFSLAALTCCCICPQVASLTSKHPAFI